MIYRSFFDSSNKLNLISYKSITTHEIMKVLTVNGGSREILNNVKGKKIQMRRDITRSERIKRKLDNMNMIRGDGT